ncbi:MAG: 16S rRNA (cytosine(967)-C(5))-methyltransferase RsmB [Gammaproteobacteria bacterium]|nr:16S rRNA (cytosine(967)-C(5))-methyltransferase RsmB [Gammaproteobacteria bacterium]MCW8922683.1 16S rRNA (cytosine(967)-C(5))-methyltransferase RsmB [Gammaproteobacteria bacterium]
MSARQVALEILQQVLIKRRSLVVARSTADMLEGRDRALAMELVNGVLRWCWKLDYLLNQFLKKPLRNKEQDVKLILLMALYELTELSTPDYAVVNEAVSASKALGKQWAKGMINGVLRNFIRDHDDVVKKMQTNQEAFYSHPYWLIALLKKDWPDHWQTILEANNQRPPLWLRVNLRQKKTEDYQALLQEQALSSVTHPFATQALKLEQGVDVTALPGFAEGAVSVQDAGAQLAAGLLDVQKGQRVLDLCAAPGGKACHVLELESDIEMVAVELEQSRMARVQENLERLNLKAELIVADASDTSWWNGKLFDRIMVDAPCSSTGVIRRHPDIKTLRREKDIDALAETQQKILQQAWQMLAPGGKLLYVTCSVLHRENEAQIAQLLVCHKDAVEINLIDANSNQWGVACKYGRQLLPGENDNDGFYFCGLTKAAE